MSRRAAPKDVYCMETLRKEIAVAQEEARAYLVNAQSYLANARPIGVDPPSELPLELDGFQFLGLPRLGALTEEQHWALRRFNQTRALLILLHTDREMISADECRTAQGRVGSALRAMMRHSLYGERGSPVFWAIALALDARAKRTSEGFVVGENAAWFGWDTIHEWFVDTSKYQSYREDDEGDSQNAALGGYTDHNFRIDPLPGNAEDRRKRARVLNQLLIKAELDVYEDRPSLGLPPEDLPTTAGLDPAVIAGALPQVRAAPSGGRRELLVAEATARAEAARAKTQAAAQRRAEEAKARRERILQIARQKRPESP